MNKQYAKIKKYRKIPVHIEEYHHDVLPHIYRGIGSKYLPLKGITFIHFDAHPDMVIPDIEYDTVFNKEKLFDNLSIENWIIPMLYAGHIDNLIWFKPVWAGQMKDMDVQFKIGHDPMSRKLQVDLIEDYFISEGAFSIASKLENVKEINFKVKTVSELKAANANKLIKASVSPYVLDIDLDFFSTKNPIKESLKPEIYEKLKSIYEYKSQNFLNEFEAEECSVARRDKISMLKSIWMNVKDGQISTDQRDIFNQFKEIYSSVQSSKDTSDIDCDMLHEFGCTCDEPELPHHISKEGEIDGLIRTMMNDLQSIEMHPVMITISRSAVDEYCPQHQVDAIQDKVLNMLAEVYEEIDVKFHYKDG